MMQSLVAKNENADDIDEMYDVLKQLKKQKQREKKWGENGGVRL